MKVVTAADANWDCPSWWFLQSEFSTLCSPQLSRSKFLVVRANRLKWTWSMSPPIPRRTRWSWSRTAHSGCTRWLMRTDQPLPGRSRCTLPVELRSRVAASVGKDPRLSMMSAAQLLVPIDGPTIVPIELPRCYRTILVVTKGLLVACKCMGWNSRRSAWSALTLASKALLAQGSTSLATNSHWSSQSRCVHFVMQQSALESHWLALHAVVCAGVCLSLQSRLTGGDHRS